VVSDGRGVGKDGALRGGRMAAPTALPGPVRVTFFIVGAGRALALHQHACKSLASATAVALVRLDPLCADRRVWGPRLPHLFGTHRPGLHSVAQLAAAPYASSSFELRSSTLLAALSHAAGGLRLSLKGMPDQRQALPQAGPAARWPSLLPPCSSHYSHARVHTSGGAQKACTFNGSTCLLRHGLCGLRPQLGGPAPAATSCIVHPRRSCQRRPLPASRQPHQLLRQGLGATGERAC
jgi:hypothetical protein